MKLWGYIASSMAARVPPAKTVVKKLRVDKTEAARLRRMARELHASESDVMREGLRLVERVRLRQRNMATLIAQAEEDQRRGPPRKARFELR